MAIISKLLSKAPFLPFVVTSAFIVDDMFKTQVEDNKNESSFFLFFFCTGFFILISIICTVYNLCTKVDIEEKSDEIIKNKKENYNEIDNKNECSTVRIDGSNFIQSIGYEQDET